MITFSNETGMKWFFISILLVAGLALILGLFLNSNIQWLQPELAAATAKRMNLDSGIEYQKAQIELQTLQHKADIDKALQDQELATKIANDQLALDRTQKFNQALGLGMNLAVLAIYIIVTVLGIRVSLAFFKLAHSKQPQAEQTRQPAQQTIRPAQVIPTNIQKERRKPSQAALRARALERQQYEVDIRLLNQALYTPEPNQTIQAAWFIHPDKPHKPTGSLPLAG